MVTETSGDIMTIHDLRNLDREEVLGWLGLTTKSSRGARVLEIFGLLAAGAVAGTAIALLFAPKTGAGLREDIRNRLRGGESAGPTSANTAMREESSADLT
jgi:hypothetical protein